VNCGFVANQLLALAGVFHPGVHAERKAVGGLEPERAGERAVDGFLAVELGETALGRLLLPVEGDRGIGADVALAGSGEINLPLAAAGEGQENA
jgi:hypothetical protein